jgi:hypothetical protein
MGSKTVSRQRIIDPGYRVPDVQPESYLCARVYVPEDTLYIGAFWSHLFELTQWLSWERGGTKAKDAAAIWRIAWDMSREEWDLFFGACDDPIPFPVQTDPSKELNDVIWAVKQVISEINEKLRVEWTAAQIKSYYAYWIAYVPGIEDMIDSMANETQQDRDTAINGEDWQSVYDTVWCDTSVCHVGDFNQYKEHFRDWVICVLRNLEEWSAGEAGLVADWAAEFINGVLPQGFLNLVNMFPGGGINLGYHSTACGWSHVFSWDLNRENWSNFYIASQIPHYLGLFSPPDGWIQEVGSGGGSYIFSCEIEIGFGLGVYLTSIATQVDYPVVHTAAGLHWYWLDSDGVQHDFGEVGLTQGIHTYTLDLDQLAYGLKVTLWALQTPTNVPPTDPATLRDVTVYGTDVNPFD